MVCTDYIIANTDYRAENFGFMASTKTNAILRFADLYNHNKALLADSFGTNIGGLIYKPTGLSFKASLDKYAPYSDVRIEPDHLPTKECRERYETYAKAREKTKKKACTTFPLRSGSLKRMLPSEPWTWERAGCGEKKSATMRVENDISVPNTRRHVRGVFFMP